MANVLEMLFDGKKIFPPIPRLDYILDLGYGTGKWAIEVAELYPATKVRIQFRGALPLANSVSGDRG
jgi:hypothetical protein